MKVDMIIKEFSELESKEERVDFLGENVNEITAFMLEKTNDNGLRDRVSRFLMEPKVAKAMKKMIASREFDIDLSLVMVITDLLTSDLVLDGLKSQLFNEEVAAKYLSIVDTLINKRVKKILKKTELPEGIISNLILECPEECSNDQMPMKRQYYFIRRLIRKFFSIPKLMARYELGAGDIDFTDIDKFNKMVEMIVGEEAISKFAFSVLLERSRDEGDGIPVLSQMVNMPTNPDKINNLLILMALAVISNIGKKDDIAKAIQKEYINRRVFDSKRDRDANRKISFLKVSKEDYPKIAKAVKIILDDNPNSKRFLM